MFNEIDAYAIELYVGEKRSGKTLTMTLDTYKDIQRFKAKKLKLYANYHLNPKFFPGAELITKERLIQMFNDQVEFMNCMFLVDELQLWLDSREHGKTDNKAISYLFGQMGKRGNVLRGTVHDYYLIDLRARLYTEKMYYILKGLVDEKGIWHQLKNYNSRLTPQENSRLYIQRTMVIRKMVKTNYLPEFAYIKSKPEYIKASDGFEMYDTREIILKQDKKEED